MQIKFNDPNSAVAFPCIARIDSAAYEEETNILRLYGNFKNLDVIFEIRKSTASAKRIITILAEGNTPNFCDMYSKIVQTDIPGPQIISIYNN